MPSLPHHLLLLGAIATAPFAAARAETDPLLQYRWNRRVVVALAASTADPKLSTQRRIFEAMEAGARERDLILLEATDDTVVGAALRRRFGGGTGFRSVLIGKDGGEKATSERPMGQADLFETIDAMPMRRAEMMQRAP